MGDHLAAATPATALLSELFSHAHLDVAIPECTTSTAHPSHSSSSTTTTTATPRTIAFYDEVLYPRIRLLLPSSSALPPPERGHAAYTLPVSVDEADDDPLEERTEQARATRLALVVLLAHLAIDLRGSYVSPRPALPNGGGPIPPTIAATPHNATSVPHNHRPTPSLDPQDAAYVNPPHPGDEVPFFSTAWSGNKPPPLPPPKKTAAERVRARKQRAQRAQGAGKERHAGHDADADADAPATAPATSFVTWDQEHEKWVVEWLAQVPVVYARHRSPHPALLVTASFSLRLSPSSSLIAALSSTLTGGSPFLALLAAQQATQSSWADHDLLATLSSGPVYPDESPSQRAARAASALAKLPLSRLPTGVLGSRLVTPQRSAADVGAKIASAIALPDMMADGESGETGDAEGDVTDGASTMTPTTPRGRDAGKLAGTSSEVRKGETVVTMHRSVRRALDVRSAVGVRMRTTVIDNMDLNLILASERRARRVGENGNAMSDEPSSTDEPYPTDEPYSIGDLDNPTQGGDSEDADFHGGPTPSSGKALVLCVEVDNPADSGLVFDVRSCDLDITVPGASPSSSKSQYAAEAVLLDLGNSSSQSGFQLAQGEQRNLLYFVRFSLDVDGAADSTRHAHALQSPWPWPSAAPTEEANRNVAIVVHGKPLLLDGAVATAKTVTPDFSSTWNCTLDMQSLQEDVRRRAAADAAHVNRASIASTSTATATIGISGSAKHTATALAAAAKRDSLRAREPPASAMEPARPMLERAASGLASAPLAGRFLQGGSRAAHDATHSSVPETPRTPSTNRSAASASYGRGVGLLAQARVRAASARIASGVFDEGEEGDEGEALTPKRVGESSHFATQQQQRRRPTDGAVVRTSAETGGGWTAAPVRKLMTPSGPRNAVRSMQAGIPMTPGASGRLISASSTATPTLGAPFGGAGGAAHDATLWASSLRPRVVLPFRTERDPSWQTSMGLLLNARVCVDEGHNGGGEEIPHAVRQMSTLRLELFITNRSSWAQTLVLSWADLDLEGGGEGEGEDAFAARHAATPAKLMDAESARRKFQVLASSLKRSALVPTENHVPVGPIPPGQSEVVALPLIAIVPGRHSLGDVVLDVVGEEGQRVVLRGVGSVVVVV